MVVPPAADIDLDALAAKVSYVGSPEHKDAPSFAGTPPRPRADATICDRSFVERRNEIESWLRDAIRQGVVSGMWEGAFPRYVWAVRGTRCYEARLVNRAQGAYKGYELRQDEWPTGIDADHE